MNSLTFLLIFACLKYHLFVACVQESCLGKCFHKKCRVMLKAGTEPAKTLSHDLTSRNDPLFTSTFIYDVFYVSFSKQKSRGGAVVSTPDPIYSLCSLALLINTLLRIGRSLVRIQLTVLAIPFLFGLSVVYRR